MSEIIKAAGINMELLDSAKASCADPEVRTMLDELRNECPEFVFLGNYSET